MYRLAFITIVMLFFGIVSVQVQAEEIGMEKAKVAFKEGVVFFKAADFKAAAESFRSAYELHPTWKLHFNIAQCEAALKHYGLALFSFENYLVDGGDDVPPERQVEVRKEMARLRDLTGELEISGPKDAVVWVDDVERGRLPLIGRIRVAAGNRTLKVTRGEVVLMERGMRVSSQGMLAIQVEDGAPTATMAAEESNEPVVDKTEAYEEPETEEDGNPALSAAGWVTAGVGVATMIGGAITGGLALSKEGQLEDACDNDVCTDPEDKDIRDSAESAALATDILLPTGGVLIAAGLIMILVGLNDEKEPEVTARWRLGPTLGATTAGVVFEGRF
jgi:hypothetical protein